MSPTGKILTVYKHGFNKSTVHVYSLLFRLCSLFLPGCQQLLLCVWCTPEQNPHPSPGPPGPGWHKPRAWFQPVWGPEPPASALQSSSSTLFTNRSSHSTWLTFQQHVTTTPLFYCTELCGYSIPTAVVCHHPVRSDFSESRRRPSQLVIFSHRKPQKQENTRLILIYFLHHRVTLSGSDTTWKLKQVFSYRRQMLTCPMCSVVRQTSWFLQSPDSRSTPATTVVRMRRTKWGVAADEDKNTS